MKKQLYTLLAVSIIFSACVEKDAASTNNNNSALAIGDTHQGGIIFYLDGNGGGLIAAPSDQSYGWGLGVAPWGCNGAGLKSYHGWVYAAYIGSGAQNTIDIEAGCTTPGTAADICANLTLGGYSDWFLPSKDELYEMYLNKAAIGDFAGSVYWSSTQFDNGKAWNQSLSYGHQNHNDKNEYWDVRAVRAF
jgi:hypothetical protein